VLPVIEAHTIIKSCLEPPKKDGEKVVQPSCDLALEQRTAPKLAPPARDLELRVRRTEIRRVETTPEKGILRSLASVLGDDNSGVASMSVTLSRGGCACFALRPSSHDRCV
jgi:hypothetical protein